MSAQAYIQQARDVRQRLRNPPNAVPDRSVELRNGRPVKRILFPRVPTPEPQPIFPQPVVTRETFLKSGRHLGLAALRGGPIPINALTVDRILRVISRHFGVSVLDIISHRRFRVVSRPRQVACYLARHMTPLSTPAIARRIGNRDHTTIMIAVRTMSAMLEKDEVLAARVEAIRRELEGRIA